MAATLKLTFNKPAVRQFIDEGSKGLRIKVENGVVMFKPASTRDGADVARLDARTRGGYEALVEGTGVEALAKTLSNPDGPFYVLRKTSKGFVTAQPWPHAEAPPKFEPHVRVWKSVTAPKKKTAAPAAPRAANSGGDSTDAYLNRVRWAYGKLGEPTRPGRPSKELVEARHIKEAFEHAAFDLAMNDRGEPKIDVQRLIQAYELIHDFLAMVAPEALQALERKHTEVQAEAPVAA